MDETEVNIMRRFGTERFADLLDKFTKEPKANAFQRGLLWGCALGNWEMLRAGNLLSAIELDAMEIRLNSV